jgi:2-hydroxycyclohexanecarboxyl-CoA dehydrogenase
VTNEQRVAIVTGAASGIGRAIAKKLGTTGHKVAIVDLDEAGAMETVGLIEAEGGSAAAFRVDVGSSQEIARFGEKLLETMGAPTVIVNNAGWDLGMPFLETDESFWRKVIDINYVGVVAMCHTLLPRMIEQEIHGHIVNIGSDAGRVGSMGETVYAGAKGAVIAFTKSLAREMARHRINVNCVSPGPTDTKLFYEQPEKVRNAVVRAIPFRRLGQPEEIAAAVSFLGSDEASFVTGQVLSVSGGLTMVG